MTTYNNINKLKIGDNTFNLWNENSNWLNGSATGSVRTIGSKTEDSSYTMGQHAVAEGYNTTASGDYSHAEGYNTAASGDYSHAEGNGTTASGDYSHAEGYYTNTTASGDYSHAAGYFTTASGSYQTVIGKYNIDDNGKVFIIGNGDEGENGLKIRSNALTVDWDGNIETKGTIYGKIPAARWISTSSAAKSVTTGTYYRLSYFTGHQTYYVSNVDSSFFETNTDGILIKKPGFYIFSYQGHFNCSAASIPAMVVCKLASSGDTKLDGSYDAYDWESTVTYSSINRTVVHSVEANSLIGVKIKREGGSGNIRPTQVCLSVVYLG